MTLYVIAESGRVALKVARLIADGKIPDLYFNANAALEVWRGYPDRARGLYTPFKVATVQGWPFAAIALEQERSQ